MKSILLMVLMASFVNEAKGEDRVLNKSDLCQCESWPNGRIIVGMFPHRDKKCSLKPNEKNNYSKFKLDTCSYVETITSWNTLNKLESQLHKQNVQISKDRAMFLELLKKQANEINDLKERISELEAN